MLMGRLACIHCAYDMAGNATSVCPECGMPFTAAERAKARRRAALLRTAPRVRRVQAKQLAGLTLLFMLEGLFIAKGQLFAALVLGALCAANIAATWLIGLLASTSVAGIHRRVVFALWQKHMLPLQEPWWMPPIFAAGVALVGGLARLLFGAESTLTQTLVVVTLIVCYVGWLVETFLALGTWADRVSKDLHRVAPADIADRRAYLMPFALLVWSINALAGLIVGVIASQLVFSWILERPPV